MQGLMREVFATLGNFRIVATAGAEADATVWLEDHPGEWDVAVIDLLLDQGTGMGVIARCRAAAPQGHIIVFSNYASPAVNRHCHKLGADAVFAKSESGRFIDYCARLAAPESDSARRQASSAADQG